MLRGPPRHRAIVFRAIDALHCALFGVSHCNSKGVVFVSGRQWQIQSDRTMTPSLPQPIQISKKRGKLPLAKKSISLNERSLFGPSSSSFPPLIFLFNGESAETGGEKNFSAKGRKSSFCQQSFFFFLLLLKSKKRNRAFFLWQITNECLL